MYVLTFYTPTPRRGRGVYCFTSVCPSKIFFVAFFSVTVDGRNLIFGHKLHIGTPYRGKRFWTHQIPTSCLPTLLIFIHIEHTFCICPFLDSYFLFAEERGYHKWALAHSSSCFLWSNWVTDIGSIIERNDSENYLSVWHQTHCHNVLPIKTMTSFMNVSVYI